MDRLSNLPDPIRNEIVSFLPIRDALRTSVLSSQWRYISSSLPKLRFKHWELKPDVLNRNFRNSVYKILASRDETNLESLFLGFNLDDTHEISDDKYVTSRDLNSWVNIALKHRIRKLTLDVDTEESINLPSNFFKCDTLRFLDFRPCCLQIPSTIRFSNVRTLMLRCVSFPDYHDNIDLVNKLFQQSTLPVLETLIIRNCPQFHTLCISIPSLSYLKLLSFRNHKRVYVSIPSLRHLVYSGCPLEVCSKTLASLENAFFEFSPNSNPNTDASDILFGLRNVETLRLKASVVESLSEDHSFFGKNPVLSATLKNFHLEMYRTEKQTQVISFLTKCFPKLQAVYVYPVDTPEDKVAEEEFVLASEFNFEDVSKLPRLEKIEFKYFGGTEAELDLVRFLLKRASDSTKVNIGYKEDLSEPQITDIEKLLTLPRGVCVKSN